MDLNLENFENHGRNAIQVELAKELYGDVFSEDEMLTRWVNEGYAKRFGDYISKHPDVEEKILSKENEEAFAEAVEEIRKGVLLH